MLYPRKIKDPAAVLDYKFTWGQVHLDEPPWLQDGETVQSHSITISPSGLTVESSDITDSAKAVTVWLSGGTLNTTYTVRCQVVTSASRTETRSMTISVQNR
ncbi:phage fiber-tail adaptor protein [Nocardia sp. NPDC004260]